MSSPGAGDEDGAAQPLLAAPHDQPLSPTASFPPPLMDRQPSAWDQAFEAAQMSPMGSATYGRSISFTLKGSLPPEADNVAAAEASTHLSAAWMGEARNLLHLAIPLALTNLVGFLIGVVALSIAGRLGQFELSAMVLATSVFNVTGLSLLIGFAAAMETFCGQAVGAGNYRMVGVVFQRALLLTTCVSALVALMWTRAESLLLVFRQDPELSHAAARYIRFAIPALWFTGLSESSKRYLMAQGVVRPPSVVTLVVLALTPLYNWLLIFHFDLGLDGAAIAVNVTQATMAALLGGYIVLRDHQIKGQPYATWHGWSSEALQGWLAYLRFALPSVLMVCIEWWTFEALIIMSGWMPDPDVSVAVMGICVNSSGLVWMAVTGLSQALSTRVSNSLGAGCPKTARRATWAGVCLALGMELVAMALFIGAREHWAALFTDAPAVIKNAGALLPVFALGLPGDGVNIVLQGLLRGSGRQEAGALINLFSYWAFCIPLSAYLAFKRDWGLPGLWTGIVATNTMQGVVMVALAMRFNYRLEAVKAQQRGLGHHDGASEAAAV